MIIISGVPDELEKQVGVKFVSCNVDKEGCLIGQKCIILT